MKKKETVIRRFFTLFAVVAILLVLMLSTCDGLLIPDGGKGGGDLKVPISRLYLNHSTFVAAVGSGATLQLELTRFPPFTTMPNEVQWRSFDENIATVDQNGKITIELLDIPSHLITVETTIRVEFIHDTSIFAVTTVMIIPAGLPRDRKLDFDWGGVAQVNAGAPLNDLIRSKGGEEANDVGDWYFGDGIFLLTGSGGISLDTIERGTASMGLDAPPDARPRLWPTTFRIDPADPYRFGVTPTGTPQVLGSWEPSSLTRFYDPYDDLLPSINDTFPGTGDLIPGDPRTINGQLRTAGAGMRAFQILGLEAPFEIVVKYRSNAAEDRWVDLRFGDTSGFRVEGPLSRNNASNTNEGRTVRFRYEDYLYSYDRDGNRYDVLENGEKIPLPPFVPIMFIELIAGIQVYEIVIRDLSND
jgi:hypothetical protein